MSGPEPQAEELIGEVVVELDGFRRCTGRTQFVDRAHAALMGRR